MDEVHLKYFHSHLYVSSRVLRDCIVLRMFDDNIGTRICPDLQRRLDIFFGQNIYAPYQLGILQTF